MEEITLSNLDFSINNLYIYIDQIRNQIKQQRKIKKYHDKRNVFNEEILISIIIGVKNRSKETLLATTALCKNLHKNTEIILIEDISSDPIAELPKEVKYFLVDSGLSGFSKSRILNYAAEQAKGKFIIPWDVSFLCNSLFIDNLIKYLEKIHFDRDLIGIPIYESRDTKTKKKGDYHGNLIIFPAEKFREVEGFRDVGNEDKDLEMRLCKKFGLKILQPNDQSLFVINVSHEKDFSIKTTKNCEIKLLTIVPNSKLIKSDVPNPEKLETLNKKEKSNPRKLEESESDKLLITDEKLEGFRFPKILHLYWDGSPMSYLNYLTVVSFNKFNKGWDIIIYTPIIKSTIISWKTSEQKVKYKGPCYFHKLKDINNVSFEAVNFEEIGFDDNVSEVIKSDYFRYYILYKRGGLWSDFDILYTGSIEEKINFPEETIIFQHPKQKYYSIRLLLAVPNSELYRYILSECKSYITHDYQSIGSTMWNKLFKDPSKIKSSIRVCDQNYYIPWDSNELEEFLIKKENELPQNNIGIHWFNGHAKSKKYAIKLEERLNKFSITCYLDTHICKYIDFGIWKYSKIPKIMFTYWYGKMSYIHYLSIKSFHQLNPDWKIQIYYPEFPGILKPTWNTSENSLEYTGIDWYDELNKLDIDFISVDFEKIGFYNDCNEIIKSDYLRLYVLSEQGGVWSDADILYIKPMSDLSLNDHLIKGRTENIDTVISYHHILKYYSIGFLLSSAQNDFFKHILHHVRENFNPGSYESIGGFLYKKLFNSVYDIVNQIPTINLVNIGLDIVYPYPSWNTNEIFYENMPIDFESESSTYEKITYEKVLKIERYPLEDPLKSNPGKIIGIHWFNGHMKAKQFINEANYTTNVTINNMFWKYLEKIVFIIPTCSKDDEIPSTCIRCVKSVRNLYPTIDIIIINDSSSLPCNSIYEYFNDTRIRVFKPEIQGSGCSYTLNKFMNLPEYDKAIVIQDSTELINRFGNTHFDIKFMWHFTEHYRWSKCPAPNNITHEDEILSFYKNLDDSEFKEKFQGLYENKDKWRGCLGNMIVISKNFLKELNEKTKILSLTNHVQTRRDRMCMESIFAIAVFYVKQFNVNNTPEYSLQGNWNDITYSIYDNNNGPKGKYLIKYSFQR